MLATGTWFGMKWWKVGLFAIVPLGITLILFVRYTNTVPGKDLIADQSLAVDLRGILQADNYQYYLTTSKGERYFIINSRDNRAILALQPKIDSRVHLIGQRARADALEFFVLGVNKELIGWPEVRSETPQSSSPFIDIYAALTDEQQRCAKTAIGQDNLDALFRDASTRLDQELVSKFNVCLGSQ